MNGSPPSSDEQLRGRERDRLERAGSRQPEHPTRPEIRLLDPDFYRDPEPLYAWMREEAPVYWDDHTGIWGITRYADIMQVARDYRTFCSGQGSRPETNAPQMINTDPPEHNLRRGIVRAGFTPRRVEAHEPYLRSKVAELIDAAAARGDCDFVRDVATPLPMYMIGELMGLPEEDHAKLLHWSDLFAAGDPDNLEAVIAAHREFVEYFTPVIEARRSRGGQDLISLVVDAEIDGRSLSMQDLLGEGGPHPGRRRRDDTTRDVRRLRGAGAESSAVGGAARRPLLAEGCRRGDAAVGLAGEEHEPDGHPRRRALGPENPRGRQGPAPLPLGQPRRTGLRRRAALRHPQDAERSPRLRRIRAPPLPGRVAGPSRAPRAVRRAARAAPRHRARGSIVAAPSNDAATSCSGSSPCRWSFRARSRAGPSGCDLPRCPHTAARRAEASLRA